MRRWLAAAALAAVAVLFLVGLGHGLWVPEETDAVERVSASPWLDAAVERAAIAVAPSARGARVGHVVLALAALLSAGLAARALRRPGPGEAQVAWIAAALLVASPAFVLAGRSVAGGVSAVAPIALATWGLVAFREEPRRSMLALASLGIVLAVGGAGIFGAIAPLAATLALGPGALRVQRAEVPIAWIVTVAIALIAGLAGLAIAAALGGRLWPDGPRFDGGLSLVLGLAPIALLVPACAIRRSHRPELLAHAVVWSIAAVVWSADPWLRLAPAVPAAIFVAHALAGGDPRRASTGAAAPRPVRTRAVAAVVAAVATLAIAALAAIAFHRAPARLAGAHLPAPTALDDVALHFGPAGWVLVAIAGLACAAIAVPRPVLRGAGAGSQTTRTAAVGIALAALAVLAWTAALHAVPAVSARRSVESLAAAAAAQRAPVEAALGVPAHAVALGRSVRALDNASGVIAFLDGACRSVVVPLAELVDVERARRGRFVVLAANDRFAVATACPLLADGPNADPLREVLLDRVPPRWGKPTDAAFAGLHLRAVKMPDRVARGVRAIDAAFAFAVTAPPSPDHRVALRVDGCKRTATFEHALTAGALEPARLRPGDVVVHRVRLPIGDLPPCRYKLAVSWGAAPPAVVKAFELR